MIEKIIATFFTKKKTPVQCVTVVGRKREICKEKISVYDHQKFFVEKDICDYFKSLKGLNTKSRGFYNSKSSALYNRQEFLRSDGFYRW